MDKFKEISEKIFSGGKEYVGKLETFMKEHKVLSGLILGALAYLLLRKKKDND